MAAKTTTPSAAKFKAIEEAELLDLPFFVYGTLMPGGYNYRLFNHNEQPPSSTAMASSVSKQMFAKVYGFDMYSMGSYPMCVPSNQRGDALLPVDGWLIHVNENEHAKITKRLDILEGHPNHYRRVVVNAVYWTEEKLVNGAISSTKMSTPAWMYIGANYTMTSAPPAQAKVYQGSWRQYEINKQRTVTQVPNHDNVSH